MGYTSWAFETCAAREARYVDTVLAWVSWVAKECGVWEPLDSMHLCRRR